MLRALGGAENVLTLSKIRVNVFELPTIEHSHSFLKLKVKSLPVQAFSIRVLGVDCVSIFICKLLSCKCMQGSVLYLDSRGHSLCCVQLTVLHQLLTPPLSLP